MAGAQQHTTTIRVIDAYKCTAIRIRKQTALFLGNRERAWSSGISLRIKYRDLRDAVCLVVDFLPHFPSTELVSHRSVFYRIILHILSNRCTIVATVPNVPAEEISALHDLYISTDSANWEWHGDGNKWNFTAPNPCADVWQGINCSQVPTAGYLHVLEIQLPTFNLAGFIPSSIANIAELQVLELFDNFLTGTIPASVGQLAQMTRFNVGSNLLQGNIPSSVGQLVSLSVLSLNGNYLTGTLSDGLGWLTNLTSLSLENNLLTGCIPNSLEQLTRLEFISLGKNRLNGTIPSFFGNLTELTHLFLHVNQLNGSIPDSLGQLTSLTELQLWSNYLSGSLPEALVRLTLLDQLAASGNFLTGTIPVFLGNLTRLRSLGLSTNRLSGTIPDIFPQLPHLLSLLLFNNSLAGTIPVSLGNLSELVELSLYDNQLTGTIPSTLEKLKMLGTFYVDNNLLSGTIPDVFHPLLNYAAFQYNSLTGTLPASALVGSDARLIQLMCNNNLLTGTLPDTTTSRRKLLQVNLGNNSFSGSLPSSLIESLQEIQFFSVCNNTFTGAIPQNWTAAAANLTYMYMHSNRFSGPIPASLGYAELLQNLNLSSNLLTGAIPASFQHLTSLKLLMLQYNYLTGGIAEVFDPAGQTNLSTVELSNNQLTGTLPAGAFMLPSLSSFAAVDNCFEGPLPEKSMCNSRRLSALVLDGLHSAKSCKHSVPLSHNAVKLGSLPTCLLSLPNLATLHLSNSGLTGSLPTEANISVVLTDLALSHNLLTGEIPSSILGRGWDKLYLSYNRFTGTLHHARGANYTNGTELKLQHNRLSGIIPGSMQRVGSLSLVQNNMFSCQVDRQDLPRQDADSATYTCGSDAVNNALYGWLGAAVIAGAAAGVAVRRTTCVWDGVLSGPLLKGLQGMFRAAQSLCWVGAAGAAYCILVLLPVYAAVNAYHPSFTYKYAWTVSGVFLTGTTTFVLEAVFLLLQILIGACAAEWLFTKFAAKRHSERSAEPAVDPATPGRRKILGSAGVLLLSLAVVTGINVGFVIATLRLNGRALTVIQIVLAVFKLAFNNVVVPALQNRVKTLGWGHEVTDTQLVLVLINLIAIPCLVVLFVSPACFYEVFKRPAVIDSSYVYSGECLSLLVVPDEDTGAHTLICAGVQTAVDTTTYKPPFTYSYQCSSSFVTSYAPTFVIMCIISGFVVPAYHLLLLWLWRNLSPPSRMYSLVTSATPRTLRGLLSPQDLAQATGDPVFDASQLVTSLLTYLALLLTSGALFPPLAVCCAVAMASVVLTARLEVGYYVRRAIEAERQDCLDEVESACAGVATPQQLRTAQYLVLTASCWFYTLFLFDTLGYEVGFAGAFWVLIVVPLLPVFILALYTVTVRMRVTAPPAEAFAARTADAEVGVALSHIAVVGGVKRSDTELNVAREDRLDAPGSSSANPMHSPY
jgi:Leucine-rich repeat (LRR) protein